LWGHPRAAKPAADADGRVLVVLAVATSVDALAAGVTLPLVGAPLLPSIVTIGITTAVLSGVGYVAGRRLGAAIGGRLDAVGGLVLIGLGVKILAEHL
jgi:putative Mn2+ efflux pump MntP